MVNPPRSTEHRNPTTRSLTAKKGEWERNCRRRLDRIPSGFWLGGLILGTVGCLLGAFMPYSHPTARTISVLWWGIYSGCFGASLGVLFSLFRGRTPAPPFQGSEDAAQPPTGADNAALSDGHIGLLHQPSQSTPHRISSDSPVTPTTDNTRLVKMSTQPHPFSGPKLDQNHSSFSQRGVPRHIRVK
jgi:hypothetical protein